MKRFILFAIAISLVAAVFYNVGDKNPRKLNDSKETGNVIVNSQVPAAYDNPLVLDTSGSIPQMTGYYDYVTNGNNLHRIWVSGDTVIVTGDQADSANSQISNARQSFYQYTFNNGVTWNDAIQMSPDGNAYPDLIPVVLTGARTVAMTGRKFIGTVRRAYTGVELVLGVGSITISLGPTGGSVDNFGALMTSTDIGCGWMGAAPSDSIYYGKFNVNTNSYSGVQLLWSAVPANARTFTAANKNQNVSIAYWNAAAPTKLIYRESTNNGTSFGTENTIFTEGTVINGTAIAPWFNVDMIYKPGTTQLCMAFGTLETGNFGTVGGYKLMFWSPAVNGGTAVKVVDKANYPPMADTNIWNERTRLIQVGMTAMSHPGLAYSSNGARLFVVYSGEQLDTSSYGYNFNDIYSQYSDDNGATWTAPRNLTNTPFADEIYPSISQKDNTPTVMSITYQLSECPGSTSFTNTTTPICKVYQIYRKYDPVTGAIIGIQNISSEIPKGFTLQQNFPNPFNPETKIRFELPKPENVTLKVFNSLGQQVAILANNESTTAGYKEVSFNGANFPSGVYFYSITAGDYSQTRKMILIK